MDDNMEKEEIFAENFQRQYKTLYPERVLLLLCPLNEYGVRKFVCTTLKPTILPYCDVLNWEGIASFVADYHLLELLEPAYITPSCMCSPTMTLQQKRGSSFDFAMVLCSLLLGREYDAYCVSGYSTKQMCLADQSLEECPLLVEIGKMSKLEQDKAALLKAQRDTERQEELAQRPSDPWHGIRVHCWVLVLSGKQDVRENFFIDPLTGKSYPTTDRSFLGIESLWNHENYWVNMQSCRDGCADILYDLGDWRMWESVLWGFDTPTLSLDPERECSDNDYNEEAAKDFVIPRSWVKEIVVSPQDKETRYPGGKKVTWYFKSKLERFSPYLQSDGLVTRLTIYTDLACTQPDIIREWYKKRSDDLKERELWNNGVTIKHFKPMRPFYLKFIRYTSPETECVTEFDSRRLDGLVRRVDSLTEMTETFQGRHDFLCFRHVVFRTPDEKPKLEICQEVVECFQRDHSKPASEDIKRRKFLLAIDQIEVTYYAESIFPVRQTFVKRKASFLFKDSKIQMDKLQYLIKEERKVIEMVKQSKAEVAAVAGGRQDTADDGRTPQVTGQGAGSAGGTPLAAGQGTDGDIL